MTNLLIGHNRYFVSSTATAEGTATGYSANNLKTGSRADTWKAAAAGTDSWVKYQVGAGEGACNYFWIAHADYVIKDDAAPSFVFATSSDDSSYSTWRDTGTLTAANLIGPNSEDFLYYNATGTPAANVYIKLTINYGAAGTQEIAKLYTGTALDLGRDPVAITIGKARGAASAMHSRHAINLEYQDISRANAALLTTTVCDVADYHPIVLFTVTNHGPLNNWQAVHVRLVDYDMPQVLHDKNDLSLSFEELI